VFTQKPKLLDPRVAKTTKKPIKVKENKVAVSLPV
jgi:hypothetical protein